MIVILAGESASGKTTLAKKFEQNNPFNFSRVITYTTRPKRESEIDGVDYHFITDDTFNMMIKNGSFVEHTEYRGWKYGTAINFGKDDNKIIILTPSGVRVFKRYAEHNPNLELDIFTIYLNVDRRSRLIKLLQRGDNIEEAYRRNLSDIGQFDGFNKEVDYVLDNKKYKNNVKTLYDELNSVITSYINSTTNNEYWN